MFRFRPAHRATVLESIAKLTPPPRPPVSWRVTVQSTRYQLPAPMTLGEWRRKWAA